MYGKRVWSTCTRTPILLVRKTRSAYIHSDPNSAHTQNTLYGKVRPKWNQGSQGHSRASPREDGPYNSPASGETPTEGFQGSPRVPPRPREDGPYSPAGLGVRHPTEGSQGSPSLQPLLTREDGPNNPAGLGRDNPPGLPGFSKGSTSSRPERTAHFLSPA